MESRAGVSAPRHRHYDFAHALRGIAALAVVISHFAGIYWIANLGIHKLLGLPPLDKPPTLDAFLSAIASARLVLGLFGVGVFFVISGFVISFSIQAETRRTFAIRRLLRIYPTYIAGFLIIVASIWGLSQLEGHRFPYEPSHILVHTLIVVRGLFNLLRIDGISWTLEVELVF